MTSAPCLTRYGHELRHLDVYFVVTTCCRTAHQVMHTGRQAGCQGAREGLPQHAKRRRGAAGKLGS